MINSSIKNKVSVLRSLYPFVWMEADNWVFSISGSKVLRRSANNIDETPYILAQDAVYKWGEKEVMIYADGWLYYVAQSTEESTFMKKIRADISDGEATPDVKKLDLHIFDAVAAEEKIYFIQKNSRFLYALNPNTDDLTLLHDDYTSDLYYRDGWLYFKSSDTIQKIRTDGSQRKVLYRGELGRCVFYGSWILLIFSDVLVKIQSEDGCSSVLFEGKIIDYDFSGDLLFLHTPTGIWNLNQDDEKNRIVSGRVFDFSVGRRVWFSRKVFLRRKHYSLMLDGSDLRVENHRVFEEDVEYENQE